MLDIWLRDKTITESLEELASHARIVGVDPELVAKEYRRAMLNKLYEGHRLTAAYSLALESTHSWLSENARR
jgi:hypothetical protein